MNKYVKNDTIEFAETLARIGSVSYDLNKNFNHYAGFLEGLMGGMFYDLSEETKKYYIKRADEKLRELYIEQINKLSQEVGERL